jgi:hypothetical protein
MTTRERQEDKRLASYSSSLGGNRSPTMQSSHVTTSRIESNTTENQRLHLHATRIILQESKDCITKFIDEVMMEISPYSAAVIGYHDQTCQNTKEVVDRYIEILNEIVISFQSALDPYIRTHDDGINYFYRWVVPVWAAQAYRNTVCSMANYLAINIKLANAMVFPNMKDLGSKVS